MLNQKSCEDTHQSEVYDKHGNSYIFYVITCRDNSTNMMSSRLKNYADFWVSKFKLDIEINVEKIEEEFYNNLISGKLLDDIRHELNIYTFKDTIIIFVDHRYFGGTFFVKSTLYMVQATPVTFPTEPSILSKLLCIGKFALFDLLKIKYMNQNIPLSLASHKLKRTKWNFELHGDILCKKSFVIYRNFCEIYSKLPTHINKLNVMIPVAFEQRNDVYNNVGAMVINIHRFDTFEDIYNKIYENGYQVVATNSISNWGFKCGRTIREKIDVIMSMFYVKDAVVDVSDAYVSYMNKSVYSLYCISISYNSTVFTTLTVNSDLLNIPDESLLP